MGSAKGTFDPNGEGSSYYCFKRPRNSHSKVLCLLRFLVPILRDPPAIQAGLAQPKAAHQLGESVGVAAPGLRSGGLRRRQPWASFWAQAHLLSPLGGGKAQKLAWVLRRPVETDSPSVCQQLGKAQPGRSVPARFSPRAHGLSPQKDGAREPASSPRQLFGFCARLTPGGGDDRGRLWPRHVRLKRRTSKWFPAAGA